jgi:hypothetical protein
MTYIELMLEMEELQRKLRVARAAMYHATSVLAQTQGDYRSLPVKNAPEWVGGLRECEALLGCALIEMNSDTLIDESSGVELPDDFAQTAS